MSYSVGVNSQYVVSLEYLSLNVVLNFFAQVPLFQNLGGESWFSPCSIQLLGKLFQFPHERRLWLPSSFSWCFVQWLGRRKKQKDSVVGEGLIGKMK